MTEDWRYEDHKMQLRSECYSTLLHNFGGTLTVDGVPTNTMKSITECSHDWVSQGNPNENGLIQFYLNNYAK